MIEPFLYMILICIIIALFTSNLINIKEKLDEQHEERLKLLKKNLIRSVTM